MAETLPFRLILASTSPARRYLLSREGYTFDVQPSHVDEPTGEEFTDPAHLVQHIAWLKASTVARRQTRVATPTLIVAADSLGWHQGQPIGKPADEADARRILSLLMGTEHELWTGVCLWLLPAGVQLAWQEASRVVLARMPEEALQAYLASRAWEGCSGAYAVQESGNDPLVTVKQGSVSNVIGLPLESLERVLDWLKRSPAAFTQKVP